MIKIMNKKSDTTKMVKVGRSTITSFSLIARYAIGTLFAIALLAIGASCIIVPQSQRAPIGGGCFNNSQCSEGLVCAGNGKGGNRICSDGSVGSTCGAVRECGDGLFCANSNGTLTCTGDTEPGNGQTVGNTDDVTQFGVMQGGPSGIAFFNNTLYMVGTSPSALYTLDQSTGIATRIGNLMNFGVTGTPARVLSPGSLGVFEGKLYMGSGSNDQRLYTLDVETGRATVVNAEVMSFGEAVSNPNGLVQLGDKFYMVNGFHGFLYEVDVITGIAKKVVLNGKELSFHVLPSLSGDIIPTSLAAIGDTLYVTGSSISGNRHALYGMNPTTGVKSRLNDMPGFGLMETSPTGLTAVDDILYMVGRDTDALHILRY